MREPMKWDHVRLILELIVVLVLALSIMITAPKQPVVTSSDYYYGKYSSVQGFNPVLAIVAAAMVVLIVATLSYDLLRNMLKVKGNERIRASLMIFSFIVVSFLFYSYGLHGTLIYALALMVSDILSMTVLREIKEPEIELEVVSEN